jgi:hypothetical protein
MNEKKRRKQYQMIEILKYLLFKLTIIIEIKN